MEDFECSLGDRHSSDPDPIATMCEHWSVTLYYISVHTLRVFKNKLLFAENLNQWYWAYTKLWKKVLQNFFPQNVFKTSNKYTIYIPNHLFEMKGD